MGSGDGEDVIPVEDFQQAIQECRKDPAMNAYFENAPAGARLFIGLQFYAHVFSETVSEAQYQQCLSEIEPDLGVSDLDYLMANVGDDEQTAAYLRDLRARLQPEPQEPARRMTLRRPAFAQTSAPVDDLSVPDLPPEEPRMSEYGRQVMEAQRLARKERLQGLCVKGVVLLGVLVVGFLLWSQFGGMAIRRFASPSGQTPEEHDQGTAHAPSAVASAAKSAGASAQDALKKAKDEAAARRKAQEDELAARKAAAAEAARAQKEQRAAEEAARKEKRAAVKRYEDIRRAFSSARYGFWQDVLDEDRPGRGSVQTTFHCLLPLEEEEEGAYAVYQLEIAPGAAMNVLRMAPDGTTEGVSAEEFSKRAGKTAHILLHGERAYFCPAAGRGDAEFRVPPSGEAFNPFQQLFGPLYEAARKFGIQNPALSCVVTFVPAGSSSEVEIGQVFFGNWLYSGDFESAVSKWMARRAADAAQRRNRKSAQRKKRTVVLSDGQMIRKRLDGVTEVPRTFFYNGSNRHRYWTYSNKYINEVRKEEIARAKWQKLYDEAVRQERAEEEALRPIDISDFTPRREAVEGVLREGRVLCRPAKGR